MKKCDGCNICNQNGVVRIPLTKLQVDHILSLGAVEKYAEIAAGPFALSKAKLS